MISPIQLSDTRKLLTELSDNRIDITDKAMYKVIEDAVAYLEKEMVMVQLEIINAFFTVFHEKLSK